MEDTMLPHVTLTLARRPDFPDGSVDHGYEIDAPLGAGGELDPVRWHEIGIFAVSADSGSGSRTGTGA
jgi:hypothetical protein